MRNMLIVVAAVFLAPTAVHADDYAILREFKTVLWPQAYRTQDVELLDRMLHDSFEMIDGEGNRSRDDRRRGQSQDQAG